MVPSERRTKTTHDPVQISQAHIPMNIDRSLIVIKKTLTRGDHDEIWLMCFYICTVETNLTLKFTGSEGIFWKTFYTFWPHFFRE